MTQTDKAAEAQLKPGVELRVTRGSVDMEFWLHMRLPDGKSAGINLGNPDGMITSAALRACVGHTFSTHPQDAESLRAHVKRAIDGWSKSQDKQIEALARAEKAEAERDAAQARVAELENSLAARGNELTAAWHQLDACPPSPASVGGDTRPKNCRFRLQDEGKAYQKSSCQACGKGVFTGLGKSCAEKGGAA